MRKWKYSALLAGCVLMSFSFASEEGAKKKCSKCKEKTFVAGKPELEVTEKEHVLLDVLNSDKFKTSEDVIYLDEVMKLYPEQFDKAYDYYRELVRGKRVTKKSYWDAITQVIDYLSKLINGSDTTVYYTETEPALVSATKLEPGTFTSLLIGINYIGTTSELSNCLNDLEHITGQLLSPKLHIKNESMIVMTDHAYGTTLYPTKKNIFTQFKNFVDRANQTKRGYFFYSGHGSYLRDTNGDEADKRDEALVPIDYDDYGMITDDEVFDAIVRNLQPDVKVTATIDACHSGTIMDLPFKWREDGKCTMEHKFSEGELASFPDIVMLSGCKDTQTSSDGGVVEGSPKGAGAMNAAYMKTLKQYNYKVTYRQLLQGVRKLLKAGGYTQEPELSSTRLLNLDDYYMDGTTLRP